MKNFQLLLTFCFISLLSVTFVNAQHISIQGTLKDDNGAAVADGSRSITFKLYQQDVGGTADWEETATVEVKGGIYSHLLGSVVALPPTIFANTLYLGVNVAGSELSPRTEMTYSPYALSVQTAQQALTLVGCQGAVGDIKYSILPPADFFTENGDCWRLMDGQTLNAGEKLRDVYNWITLPDMRGYFLRAHEGATNNDPGRSTADIGTLQDSDNKSHAHSMASAGAHSHTVTDTYFAYGGSGGFFAPNEGSEGNEYQTRTTSTAGAHTHTIYASGGAESRPKNKNFYLYIRVE